MSFHQGDCFFNRAGRDLKSHPWVILSDPQINEDDVLIVNYTDINKIDDMSCKLDVIDHPGFITKPCCVHYREAKVTSVNDLRRADSAGALLKKSTVPDETLDKILAGAYESDELKGAHRQLLRDQRIID